MRRVSSVVVIVSVKSSKFVRLKKDARELCPPCAAPGMVRTCVVTILICVKLFSGLFELCTFEAVKK